jgi:hypothetical protein
LPLGSYTVVTSGGPEYLARTTEFRVAASGTSELAVALERWLDPPSLGWFSGDHHIPRRLLALSEPDGRCCPKT